VFHIKGVFEAHMMLHTGENRYVCSDCGYSTRFSGNLTKHNRVVHGKRAAKAEVRTAQDVVA
jgi:DNA-directed RNA polymerase subunit M/transcription elongation factor TFIIS